MKQPHPQLAPAAEPLKSLQGEWVSTVDASGVLPRAKTKHAVAIRVALGSSFGNLADWSCGYAGIKKVVAMNRAGASIRVATSQFLITATFVAYLVIAVVLSLVMPNEPMKEIQQFSSAMASFITSINSVSEVSKFPSAASATLALLWISVPIVAFGISQFVFRPHFRKSESKTSDLILAAVLSGIFFSVIAFFPPILGTFDNTDRPYQFLTAVAAENRLIFGLMAGAFVAAAVYMLALCAGIFTHLLFRQQST